jgi:hypothetical protein
LVSAVVVVVAVVSVLVKVVTVTFLPSETKERLVKNALIDGLSPEKAAAALVLVAPTSEKVDFLKRVESILDL